MRNRCSIEGCDKYVYGHGWCEAHYTKVRKYGDPLATGPLFPRGLTVAERFVNKVDFTGECWLWTGKVERNGYGRFAYRENGVIINVGAHRFAYELWVGPIPEGLTIDHVVEKGCTHKHCVRALGHLEPVTPAEQNRRHYSRFTACSNGHAYTKENTKWVKNGTQRVCRQCGRDRVNAHYRRTHPGASSRN